MHEISKWQYAERWVWLVLSPDPTLSRGARAGWARDQGVAGLDQSCFRAQPLLRVNARHLAVASLDPAVVGGDPGTSLQHRRCIICTCDLNSERTLWLCLCSDMMEPPPSLGQLLDRIPSWKLEQKITDNCLEDIAKSLKNWKSLCARLGITEVEEEEIEYNNQKLDGQRYRFTTTQMYILRVAALRFPSA